MSTSPAPATPPPPPPHAKQNPQSQLYYGITFKQLNVAVIAILIVLVLLIIVLTYYKARRWRLRPRRTGVLQPVGDRGLLVRENLDPARGLDEEIIKAVGPTFNYVMPPSATGDAGDADDVEAQRAQAKDVPDGVLECVVCLANYKDGERLKNLNACGHSFHEDCIDAWLRGNSSCPLCRTSLKTKVDGTAGDGSSGGTLETGAGEASASGSGPTPGPDGSFVAVDMSDATAQGPGETGSATPLQQGGEVELPQSSGPLDQGRAQDRGTRVNEHHWGFHIGSFSLGQRSM